MLQRRFASTVSKTPRAFPPPEAKFSKGAKDASFSPQVWTALQPQPDSALSAFAHRIGVASAIPSAHLIRQACTHPSYTTLHRAHYPAEPSPATNASLAALGNSLLGLFATEHVHASYPHLPTRAMKAAVSAYVGVTTCTEVAKEMGATPLLRWNRTPPSITKNRILHPDALATVPRALTALIYHHRSIIAARKFAHAYFLSRDLDLRPLLKFRDPKLALSDTVKKYGRERPVSRLLKETGRASNSPIFVVGIYSGGDKLGEGFGSSLKMAEYRAAEDALHRLYLTRTPPHLLSLPTSTFPAEGGSIFAEGSVEAYTPHELGQSEVLLGSTGKTGITVSGRRRSDEDVEVDAEVTLG